MSEEQVKQEEIKQEDGEGAFREFVHHQRMAIEELGKAVESLLPREFREHTKNAGKAFIESFRSLFEAAKDDLEQAMKRRDSSGEKEGATKVKVEIE